MAGAHLAAPGSGPRKPGWRRRSSASLGPLFQFRFCAKLGTLRRPRPGLAATRLLARPVVLPAGAPGPRRAPHRVLRSSAASAVGHMSPRCAGSASSRPPWGRSRTAARCSRAAPPMQYPKLLRTPPRALCYAQQFSSSLSPTPSLSFLLCKMDSYTHLGGYPVDCRSCLPRYVAIRDSRLPDQEGPSEAWANWPLRDRRWWLVPSQLGTEQGLARPQV